MIKYETFYVGPMDACSYLVYDDGGEEAVVIDAGGGYSTVSKCAHALNKKICAVLLTHGHFDHTLGAAEYQRAGIPVGISTADEHMLAVHRDNLARMFGLPYTPISADFTFRGGAVLTYGKLSFKVILTPGHTIGSCCFLCDNVCFSGDTLFCESVGRTDFPTGSHAELISSIKKKLLSLPDETTVCPGHNEQTTIAHERLFNPYLV